MEGLLLFAVSLLSLGAIYAILCLALNLEAGGAGLWDLGIVSFFGIGAYTYALLTAPAAEPHQNYLLGLGLSPVAGLAGAAVAGAITALLIGLPTLRLKREYFLITTLAFAEVLRQVFANEDWLTNGVAGIYGLEQPFRDVLTPSTLPYAFLVIILASLAIVYWLVAKVSGDGFGRALKALRENEPLAMTAGIYPFSHYLRVFMLAGALSGVAGAYYVWYNTLVVPGQFSSNVTFFVWTALIIGGLGNNRGALIGGFLFVVMHDALRFIQASSDMALFLSSLRTVMIGAALILILRFRPSGLLPERPARIAVGGR